ncbi:hypothetical protein BJX62DRAFT_232368 [Aspergillus germanicus]
MHSLNTILAIWIALLAVFAMALPFNFSDKIGHTNVTTTANGQFPISLLDLPDSADLLARTLWKPEPDVTCDPEGWVRNEPRWYSWSVHEVEKEKGELTVHGKKCVRLACYREAAAYVCNMNKGRLFLEYKDITESLWKVFNTCQKEHESLFAGFRKEKPKWVTVLRADTRDCSW